MPSAHETVMSEPIRRVLSQSKRNTHKPIGNCGQIIALCIEVLQAARIVAKVSFAVCHRFSVRAPIHSYTHAHTNIVNGSCQWFQAARELL